jgi:hypothetical protein
MSGFPVFGTNGQEPDLAAPKSDGWIGDAMSAEAPGETRCGVQIPEIRVGEQTAVAIEEGFFRAVYAANPRLAVAIQNRDACREAVRGWHAQVGELRANVARLRNLIQTSSGLQGGKDTDALRKDLIVAADLLDQAREGLEHAQLEQQESEAEITAALGGGQ